MNRFVFFLLLPAIIVHAQQKVSTTDQELSYLIKLTDNALHKGENPSTATNGYVLKKIRTIQNHAGTAVYSGLYREGENVVRGLLIACEDSYGKKFTTFLSFNNKDGVSKSLIGPYNQEYNELLQLSSLDFLKSLEKTGAGTTEDEARYLLKDIRKLRSSGKDLAIPGYELDEAGIYDLNEHINGSWFDIAARQTIRKVYRSGSEELCGISIESKYTKKMKWYRAEFTFIPINNPVMEAKWAKRINMGNVNINSVMLFYTYRAFLGSELEKYLNSEDSE